MANNNGIISWPVEIADIQEVLSDGSVSLGILCRSRNINMWAKWKPVTKAGKDTMAQLAADKSWKTDAQLSDPWWRGTNLNYGLTFSQYPISLGQTGVEDAINLMTPNIDGRLNTWAYTPPTGVTMASPFRIIDFNRYNHRVKNPIRGFKCTSTVEAAQAPAPWNVVAEFMETDMTYPISERDYITPMDIAGVTLYPGIVIFKKSGSTYIPMAWCTGKTWEGNGIQSQDVADGVGGRSDTMVEARFSSNHTYYMIPVYFTVELAQPQAGYSALPTAGGAKIIPVPFVTFDSFDCYQASTSQKVGMPVVSSHDITTMPGSDIGNYIGTVSIDSRGSYYVGGTHVAITVGLVNSLWDGNITTPSSDMYNYWNTFTDLTIPDDAVTDIVSLRRTNLNMNYAWKFVIVVDGTVTEIGLRQSQRPIET